MASFYVHRARDGREGWVGPIRSQHQAVKEVAAWVEAGWSAVAVDSTPEIRREVNAWQKDADRRLGRVR